MKKPESKPRYKNTLISVFLGIFSVVLSLVMLLYFVAFTARQRSDQREMILADASARFDIANAELLMAFSSLSHLQRTSTLRNFAESPTDSEMYLAAIDAQSLLAGSTLDARRLEYYNITAICLQPNRELAVTPTESMALNTFAARIGIPEEQLRDIYHKLSQESLDHYLLYNSDNLSRGNIHYLTLQSYPGGDLMCVLTIDRENFAELFGSLNSCNWMISIPGEILAASCNDLKAYEPIMEFLDTQKPDLSETLSPLNQSFSNKNLLGAQFSLSDWRFFATYPSIRLDLRTLITAFLLPLLLLGLCSLVLAHLFSRRLYAPVKELLVSMGGENEQSNEFDYIRNRTSEISEKARQLDVYLKRSQLLLTEQVFKNALLDANFNAEDAQNNFENQSFLVALTELAEELPESDAFTMAQTILRDTVRTRDDMHFLSMSDSSFALILHCDSTEEGRQRIQSLFSETGISTHLRLRVALSSTAVGLSNLHMLMDQCNHLMEYRHNMGDQMFVTAEDAARIYYDGYYYPLKVETNLVQMTVNGVEGALALLEEIMHENLVNKILSLENQRSFCFALVSTLNRIYQELQLTGTSDYPAINDLLSYEDTDQLLQEIRTTFARIVWNTSNRNADIKEDYGQRMTDYIRQNYQQDISLDQMAESLNISPKYCSALFKKQTGHTFKKALNEYRVERAREILEKTPDVKISDLAVDVGFTSANTFIQVFKQYTGTTPRQYATHMEDPLSSL